MSGVPPRMVDVLWRVRRRLSGTRLWDVLHRTRLNADTIKGAAPDVTVGRAAAVRAGARPYHRMPVVSSDFLNPPTLRVRIRIRHVIGNSVPW